MELCNGSMLDYLQEKSPWDSIKLDSMSRVMFETACGLVYLHEKNIIHGCLTLDKVLLWMENNNPNSKAIVKISEYYTKHIDSDLVIKKYIVTDILL